MPKIPVSALKITKHAEPQETTAIKNILNDSLEIIYAAAIMSAALVFLAYVI